MFQESFCQMSLHAYVKYKLGPFHFITHTQVFFITEYPLDYINPISFQQKDTIADNKKM